MVFSYFQFSIVWNYIPLVWGVQLVGKRIDADTILKYPHNIQEIKISGFLFLTICW